MAIIRNPITAGYKAIDNRILADHRLSWKARGILAYLLSKPDHWEVMVQHLVNSGPDGRDAVRGALKELEEVGYLTKEMQPRGEKGTFDSVSTTIHEVPTTGWPGEAAEIASEAAEDADEGAIGTNAQVATEAGYPSTGEPSTGEPSTDNHPRVIANSIKTEEVMTEEVSCATAKSAEDIFERLWLAYPRKQNRIEARDRFLTLRKNGVSTEDLIRATLNFVKSVVDVEPKFIMMGSTFYGPKERWRDYLDAPHPEQHTSAERKPVNSTEFLFEHIRKEREARNNGASLVFNSDVEDFVEVEEVLPPMLTR